MIPIKLLWSLPMLLITAIIGAAIGTDSVEPISIAPVQIERLDAVVATTTTTTTTTLPDFSGVDFVQLARNTYGKCGEFHDTAISVGWPEEEWENLQHIMWRESRCTVDAWNGHDAGLTQINQIHTKWLNQMGFSHPDDMFDPEKNLLFAYRLWEGSGWRPWRFSGSTFGD
jgi:hypothetical protein